MCWWKQRAICVCAVVLVALSAASARAESILRLDHNPKPKAAAKAKPKNTFSLPALPTGDDSNLDRSAHFLLAGKKEQAPIHLVSIKKKTSEPPIQEGGKHAKKVQLKGIKVTPKPVHNEPAPDLSVQWALPPTPMAASAAQVPASVPAPQSLWAGLGMLAAIGVWRHVARRRMAAQ